MRAAPRKACALSRRLPEIPQDPCARGNWRRQRLRDHRAPSNHRPEGHALKLVYLLDTGIVSAPMTKTPDSAVLERLDAHGPDCAIAAPVWHELTYGCRRLSKGRR